jgi:putative phage-type endonuclease
VKRIDLTQNTPEWEAWRDAGLGASDAPAVVGVSPYLTPEQLWQQKTGAAAWAGNSWAQRRGRRLEPVARKAYEWRAGRIVQPCCAEHDDLPWLKASLDGLSFEGTAAAEIKCLKAEDHRRALAGVIPYWYKPQLDHLLLVTGLAGIDYVSFNPDSGFTGDDQLAVIPYAADPARIAAYRRPPAPSGGASSGGSPCRPSCGRGGGSTWPWPDRPSGAAREQREVRMVRPTRAVPLRLRPRVRGGHHPRPPMAQADHLRPPVLRRPPARRQPRPRLYPRPGRRVRAVLRRLLPGPRPQEGARPVPMTPPELRDALLAYIGDHETGCTTTGRPGSACWGERANIIAYLCHAIGVRGPRLYQDVARLLAEYDAHCRDPHCKHERN